MNCIPAYREALTREISSTQAPVLAPGQPPATGAAEDGPGDGTREGE